MRQRLRGAARRRVTAIAAVGVMLAAGLAAASAPAQAAEENLIVNGGFEAGVADWFVNNGNSTDGATLSATSDAYAGSGAALVTGRATTGSGPMQDLSGKVQAGQTYALTARIKYENAAGPATKQFFATMHYGGSTYTNLVSVTATKGQWAQFNGTFTIPASQNVSTARIFFETPWTSTPSTDPALHLMDFKLDDVSVIGAPPPPPPSRTIEVVGKLPGEHNPLIGHKFGADGFGFVHDGRVYLYLTNDTQGYAPDPVTGISPSINYGNINQITLISSEDLVNWTDHGEIQVAGPNGVAPFTGNSWAPGMAKKMVNGKEKFFLYYANGGGSSNVITGESPLGPWTSERTSTLINGSTPGAEDVAWKFDPAPLVDDDGQAYLYFGGGPASTSMPAAERFNNPKNIRAIRLGDDMVSTQGSAVVVDTPVSFEAAQVFKRQGKYYLSYSSHFGGADFGGNQTPLPGYPGGGQIGYLISDDPMSWPKETYAGVLFPNQSQFFGAGTGGNNHQSVFEFGGKYYFTYHAPTLNKRINGNTTQGYRSPHIQELTFNPDGTIQQVVGTYAGVDQVRDFNPYRVFEAETFGWSKGIATAKVDGGSAQFGTSAPNLAVRDIDNGDWTALSSVDFGTAGAASVTAKVRALAAGGRIQVRLDDVAGPVVGTVEVDTPVGEWAEVTAALQGVSGVHDVYFTYAGPTGTDLFELDSWKFAAATAQPELPVTASAQTRCVGGRAYVAVQATNGHTAPVDITLETPYGTRTVTNVAPGANAYQSFTTRATSIPAGTATIRATGTVDGTTVTTEVTTTHPAQSCGG
ncbi:family 43 glycosylhydrolase [Micromonospora carbonacea]|uniref:Family 43 glycosylhydrolase n=1 Tax=Micromonospora carbonacea TaxID=47853 RepID=A0A7H8XFB3_9ACTN|nr:family 43 glycosylhydrolase [Micromonospora carbonacea]MBB5829156.1 arabinoxylan arabinofuranohydrolase [Micromonospora carbonacea]QLD23364.1 family 43 glycosylhydrolase [Micromonospora carbonacea]